MPNIPNSFVKNIAIRLRDDYSLSNEPIPYFHRRLGFLLIETWPLLGRSSSEQHKRAKRQFIGREDLQKKFLAFLEGSKKGVYLVTGYRGMGKTSFVNHVLNQYRLEDRKRINAVHLTLAQENPNEWDVLRQLVSSLCMRIQPEVALYHLVKNSLCATVGVVSAWYFIKETFFVNGGLLVKMGAFGAGVLGGLAVGVVLRLLLSTLLSWAYRNYYGLVSLRDRCYAVVSEERDREGGLRYQGLSGSIRTRRGKAYPIATSKEIEFELSRLLSRITRWEFVFVFDELDKVEGTTPNSRMTETMEVFEQNRASREHHSLRDRKQAVLGLIAGLKNFLTSANARFIFIAGREMFDASLADIADKQSPLSSIFTYTFHIESLLKAETGYEGEKNISSLSTGIEEFLKRQLFESDTPEFTKRSLDYFLDSVAKNSEERENRQFRCMMQAFITYLVYRTGGAPKKLIRTFQEFVMIGAEDWEEKETKTIIKLTTTQKLGCAAQEDGNKSYNYLYFNYFNQHRIGLVNAIYRPYTVMKGRTFKAFSENTVISVPYLFDHLFKFHSFAFSTSYMELIPEIMSTNKTPALKQDLKDVIRYLYNGPLRETDIQLFDYKFSSKTASEIAFISRVFEEDAAAYNFTLDESYPIKAVLIDKIKELRSVYAQFKVDAEQLNPQIFSISNLNASLADLYFFDGEYLDALNGYSDAIRMINHLSVDRMNIRDFTGLIRNKLKIGLCFQKISSFDDALGIYADAVLDIKRFYAFALQKANYVNIRAWRRESEPKTQFMSAVLSDLLHLCVQPFLAQLYVQEKLAHEGVSSGKARLEFGEFIRICEEVELHCGRNRLVLGNACLHHGHLLYYKNSFQATQTYDPKAPEPEWYVERRKTIDALFGNYYESRRQPTLAIKLYLLGLDEVVRGRAFFRALLPVHSEKQFLCSDTRPGPFLRAYLDKVAQFLSDETKEHEQFTSNFHKAVATFLSCIGDCILGMEPLPNVARYRELSDLISPKGTLFAEVKNDCFDVPDALNCYLLSARFYEFHGHLPSAVFEYRKILQTIMVVVREEPQCLVANLQRLTRIDAGVRQPARELLRRAGGRTGDHMKLKILKQHARKLDSESNSPSNWNVSYEIANAQDSKEIDLLYEMIRMKLKIEGEPIEKMVNSYYPVSTQALRITELDYYCKVLWSKAVEPCKTLKLKPGIRAIGIEVIHFVYTSNALIRLLQIYETDYFFSPGYLAYRHYKLACFLSIGEVKNHLEEQEHLLSELKEKVDTTPAMLAENTIYQLETLLGGPIGTACHAAHHYGMAVDLYLRSIEMHTAGTEYKRHIHDLIYLEDDFNDNNYRFGAALDRYQIVHGVYDKRIQEIKGILGDRSRH